MVWMTRTQEDSHGSGKEKRQQTMSELGLNRPLPNGTMGGVRGDGNGRGPSISVAYSIMD